MAADLIGQFLPAPADIRVDRICFRVIGSHSPKVIPPGRRCRRGAVTSPMRRRNALPESTFHVG
jgi:hypothetical protein